MSAIEIGAARAFVSKGGTGGAHRTRTNMNLPYLTLHGLEGAGARTHRHLAVTCRPRSRKRLVRTELEPCPGYVSRFFSVLADWFLCADFSPEGFFHVISASKLCAHPGVVSCEVGKKRRGRSNTNPRVKSRGRPPSSDHNRYRCQATRKNPPRGSPVDLMWLTERDMRVYMHQRARFHSSGQTC